MPNVTAIHLGIVNSLVENVSPVYKANVNDSAMAVWRIHSSMAEPNDPGHTDQDLLLPIIALGWRSTDALALRHAIPNFGGFCFDGNAPLHRWQVCAVGTNYGHRDRRRFDRRHST